MRRARAGLLVLIFVLGAPSCCSAQQWPGSRCHAADRLYFGRDIPGGGAVSDQDWQLFLAEVATPLFPDGLTVWRAEGQWRDQSGAIVREPSFVLEIFGDGAGTHREAVRAVAEEYKRRFKQEAVLWVHDAVAIDFL